MRTSAAGLALIRRVAANCADEFLTQWSDSWQMFSLIGGHVKPGESFRECCVREVIEELGLVPEVEFRVAPLPLRPRQEYVAFSHSAGVETRYEMELFATDLLAPSAIAKVDAHSPNRWLKEAEIRAGVARDGRPISAQVAMVLALFGALRSESGELEN